MIDLRVGNSLEVLKEFPDNSVDSIVTDPPYGLSSFDEKKIRTTLTTWLTNDPAYIPEGKGFMGKDWDGFVPPPAIWSEVFRVLKPGGHLICFAGTRTVDLMTISLRLAGFEIRDTIMWLYGSGFPKSHDVSKALDKQAGAERELIRTPITPKSTAGKGLSNELDERPRLTKAREVGYHEHAGNTPATDLAKQWHGWGTAIKPAHEPAVLARKPLTGTVADNVLTWGTGALNIDGCRVATDDDLNGGSYGNTTREVDQYFNGKKPGGAGQFVQPSGRWPANVILDESAGEALDEQSDATPSRFFYTAKASKAEREAGLDASDARANHHPTVKPIALMRYLVRLVTPPNGVVLDPFMGSGSTGCAAVLEGMQFIGIELSEEYKEIAEKRIAHWQAQNPMNL
jgi:site-specific DNA-methyltransferase (adenine-specific)